MKGVNHVQAFKAQYINQQSTEDSATNPEKLNFTSIKVIKIKANIKKAGRFFRPIGKTISQRVAKVILPKTNIMQVPEFKVLRGKIDQAESSPMPELKNKNAFALKECFQQSKSDLRLAQQLFDESKAVVKKETQNNVCAENGLADCTPSVDNNELLDLLENAANLVIQRKSDVKQARKAYEKQQSSDISQHIIFIKAEQFMRHAKKLEHSTASSSDRTLKGLKSQLSNLESLNNKLKSTLAKGDQLLSSLDHKQRKHYYRVGRLRSDIKKKTKSLVHKTSQIKCEIENTKQLIKSAKIQEQQGDPDSTVQPNNQGTKPARIAPRPPMKVPERSVADLEEAIEHTLEFCDSDSISNPRMSEQQISWLKDRVTDSLNDTVTDKGDLNILLNDFLDVIDETTDEADDQSFPDPFQVLTSFGQALNILSKGEPYEKAAAELLLSESLSRVTDAAKGIQRPGSRQF